MIIALRIILIALWLIATNLIIFDFQPGGRYLVLLEAVITGFIAQGIRSFVKDNPDQWLKSLLSAAGLFIGLGLTKLIFPGIRLTIPGLLLAFGGVLLVEMVLPKEFKVDG